MKGLRKTHRTKIYLPVLRYLISSQNI